MHIFVELAGSPYLKEILFWEPDDPPDLSDARVSGASNVIEAISWNQNNIKES